MFFRTQKIFCLVSLIIFFAFNSESTFSFVKLPTSEQIIESRHGSIVYSDKSGVWHKNLKSNKRTFIDKSFTNEDSIKIGNQGRWVAYEFKDKLTSKYIINVFDADAGKIVLSSQPLPLLLFYEFIGEKTLLIGTTESTPISLYKLNPKDHNEKLNPFIFSAPQQGTWIVHNGTKLTPYKIDDLTYEVRISESGKIIYGSLASGGVFWIDQLSKTPIFTQHGYRPSLSPDGNFLIYETPKNEIFIWSPKSKIEKKIANGAKPKFISNEQAVYTDGKVTKTFFIKEFL